MTLVAPVNLPYNIKTLWFNPKGLDIHPDDKLVVRTARGVEMGTAASGLIEVSDEQIAGLKSPLQPVLRIATEADIEKAREMERLSAEALPIFKEMARETSEEMHPVSVEYMLDGDKAVFYFEAEKRIDFRDLVRKLASTFHVRIDMRQIGVRDEARIVGGVAHCGQIVCCKRLGGEFKPVSIRMAKDQDLSLNSQKISGLCGRLMCCLRYEEDVYKEFKSHAPKVDARVSTPDGEGRIVEHDVPRDSVSIKAGDSKPVKVPLSAIEDIAKDRKSCAVDEDAWQEAVDEANSAMYGTMQMIELPSFTGEDKLGSGKAVHHETSKGRKRSGSAGGSGSGSGSDGRSPKGSRRGSKRGSGSGAGEGAGSGAPGGSRRRSGKGADGASSSEGSSTARRQRRRSTKISGTSGERETVSQEKLTSSGGKGSGSGGERLQGQAGASGSSKGRRPSKGASGSNSGSGNGSKGSRRGGGSAKGAAVRPGQKSSGLAQGRSASSDGGDPSSKRQGRQANGNGSGAGATSGNDGNKRRRRRRRRSGGSGQGQSAGAANGDGRSSGSQTEASGSSSQPKGE